MPGARANEPWAMKTVDSPGVVAAFLLFTQGSSRKLSLASQVTPGLRAFTLVYIIT
jgi:hypothetical protein